mmetsp:Transcript_2433/g.5237  ORF Transcript_2433/g.5237 Transcript_2433/m.5237 type:complete len:197 (+) Transcript_2433:2-592(+)
MVGWSGCWLPWNFLTAAGTEVRQVSIEEAAEWLVTVLKEEPEDIRDNVDGKQMGRPLAVDSAVRWMTSFESSRSKYGPATPFVVASEDRFLSHCCVRFGETQLYPDEVVSAWGVVYTIPQERQKGWAKACVRAATDFALKQPGIKRVVLLVADRNLEARKFYESLGFTPSSHTLLNNDIPMTFWTAQLGIGNEPES